MFTGLGESQYFIEGVIDTIGIDIQAVVQFLDHLARNILALQVLLVDLKFLHCPQRTSLLHLNLPLHFSLAFLRV
jgi:hypothetical protein